MALILLIAGILGVVFMKHQSDVLKESFQTVIDCPDSVEKIDALNDHMKEQDSRLGLMHCYCLDEAREDPTNFYEIKFETSIDPVVTKKYC